jgi:protein farnesyltransferase subunit beta
MLPPLPELPDPEDREGAVLCARVVDTLARMQRVEDASTTLLGGFGGGPGQLPHCAPTYAATLSLVTVGTEAALRAIDRRRLYRFLMSMRTPEGAFRMHHDGEVDTRAAYTALCVASLTNILTPELSAGTAEWIARCQTFEGGFGAEPFNEAHGGYAFCAVAALAILDRMDAVDLDGVLRWVTLRQMPRSGGFQGRGNKLVDACYSFWQGSTPAVLAVATQGRFSVQAGAGAVGGGEAIAAAGSLLMDQERLQEYILKCCQYIKGGLRDKPGKGRDYYHTCYALSGLSIAQHSGASDSVCNAGSDENVLRRTDPIYNVRVDKLASARAYFSKLSCSHESLMETPAAAPVPSDVKGEEEDDEAMVYEL